MTHASLEIPAFPTRRGRTGPGVAVGVTEPMIHDLVHAFYARVRDDAVLGPIFDDAIGDHWDAHLAKLCDFWSSVMLGTGRFKGQPMAVHAAMPNLRPCLFARWLNIFAATAGRVCPGPAAALFAGKAETIARSLLMGWAAEHGAMKRPPSCDAAAEG